MPDTFEVVASLAFVALKTLVFVALRAGAFFGPLGASCLPLGASCLPLVAAFHPFFVATFVLQPFLVQREFLAVGLPFA